MESNENKEIFQYTYSAKEQEELRRIRSKYMPKEETKMEQLRRLDASVSQKATMLSLLVGLAGTLVLGLGMSLAMTELGTMFGKMAMAAGCIVGVIGIGLIAIAYPSYNRVLKKERERIAPEILRLTDELMK